MKATRLTFSSPGHAGQYLPGKGGWQNVFLTVQALAFSIRPGLYGARVIDRVLTSVVVVIADVYAADQRLCSSRAVTPGKSDKHLGLRTWLAPHVVEQGENGGDAGQADRNGDVDYTRSHICCGAAIPIIVGGGRNRKRDAPEILGASWKCASA